MAMADVSRVVSPRLEESKSAGYARGEVFILGSILGTSTPSDNQMWCEWKIVHGPEWSATNGCREGKTHRSKSSEESEGIALW